MTAYLAKYRPLLSTPEGQRAAERFKIPPFVDGSCRREPDLESKFPSITALCRGALFAPKLSVGDEVIYITFKNFYRQPSKHWRIVARLRVHRRFESHQHAAQWYRNNVVSLPSNCMVAGNPPKPLSQTLRAESSCGPGCSGSAATLKEWNDHYQKRANDHPVFLACELVWKELNSPAILTQAAALEILKTWDRVNARSPITISQSEAAALEKNALSRKPQ